MRSIRLMNARAFGLVVILTTALAAAQLDELVVDDDLEGPNVCKEVEQYQVFVTAPREITYQERYQKWCVAVPPRCSAYRVRTKIVNETTGINKERILKKCCSGYAKNKELNRCEPVCNPGCRHGKCIAPETCRCDQGYVGKSCNIIISDKPLTLWEEFVKYKKQRDCPPNRWGSDCSQVCKCKNNSTCDAQDGSCSCPKGYRGTTCEFQCPSDRFGQDCAEMCQCLNGGKCDPVSGECYCAPGFTGPLCAQKCPEGKHGDQCQSDCRCQNGGSCDSQTGVRCESRCQMGLYGESCSEVCACHNNSSCDPITGECICSRGWTGANCDEPCPDGFFGHGCKERCPGTMHGNTTCNHITGKYSCRPGYIGTTCEHPCPTNTYGPECSLKCTCKNGGECSHETGMCQCPPGWTGANCEAVCPNGFYGPNCSQKCSCKNDAKCRKNDGQCICNPGWMGNRCDEVCPEGFYGNHCMDSCNCPAGNFVCHAALGCLCSNGYTGEKCDVSAAEAKIHRKDEDLNENSTNYQGVTGNSLDLERLESSTEPALTTQMEENPTGNSTYNFDWKIEGGPGGAGGILEPNSTNDDDDEGGEETTPTAGEDFGKPPLDDYIHLPDEPHAARSDNETEQIEGQRRWKGNLTIDDESSNFTLVNSTLRQEKLFASNAGLAWGLVLAVMFVGVIIALVLYYRRRVANLKAEVNHVVNYMCQEQPGHFDNPVYSAYQGQPGSGSGAAAAGNRLENNGLLPNGSLIRNNLRTQKSNLDKYRYPENESVGTDRSYSIQYLTESQKNFDADMTNPNYNTIDDKDHVYDEIKHKDGYKDLDTEYDHLDYSRPGSSHKTHYFRMPNPMSGGSPKEINVLRENGTTINNLSSPGLNIRQPLVVPVINAADCGSSSTNSSPTPPMLRANDSSNLYVKMTSEGRPRREVIRSAPAAAAVAIRFPSTSSISSRNVSRFCVCLVFEKSCECVRTQLGISDPLVNKQSPGEKLA
ncbi:protein draper isoform X8 [Culex quinquefasciatus]|uniref:protein draper isoform X8 n=1 Tax=Culex quinquefasciatus TaxID=7176 RepID=UPI0018E3994E|nr:protein draper isoform X8 [Culex quinquefasciatus]